MCTSENCSCWLLWLNCKRKKTKQNKKSNTVLHIISHLVAPHHAAPITGTTQPSLYLPSSQGCDPVCAQPQAGPRACFGTNCPGNASTEPGIQTRVARSWRLETDRKLSATDRDPHAAVLSAPAPSCQLPGFAGTLQPPLGWKTTDRTFS